VKNLTDAIHCRDSIRLSVKVKNGIAKLYWKYNGLTDLTDAIPCRDSIRSSVKVKKLSAKKRCEETHVTKGA